MAELVLHCNQTIDAAHGARQSDVRAMFESKTFADWKKAREHEMKLQLAMIERLDGVIKSLHNIAKAR